MKLCFIITCKVYHNYTSYLTMYVNNIINFYNDSLIILVDNNSDYSEYFNQFRNIKNVVILENISEQKFEIGANNFAINYIINNNLIFDYYICTGDTFILVNNYNFEILKNKNICACTINYIPNNVIKDNLMVRNKLCEINLADLVNEPYDGCLSSSFVCNHDSLLKINLYTKNIRVTSKNDAMNYERLLGALIYLCNNHQNYCLEEKNNTQILYDFWNVDPNKDKHKCLAFLKIGQGKSELTENNQKTINNPSFNDVLDYLKKTNSKGV